MKVSKSLFFPVFIALSVIGLHAQSDSLISEEYTLGPGDTISVSVFNEGELGVTQRLDTQGKIVLPLLGEANFEGLTVRQAEDMLEKRYVEEELLVRPEVTVQITDYRTRTFYVFGEVRSPGTKNFPSDRNRIPLIEAISMAGDFSEFARTGRVEIRRRSESGEESVRVVDAASLISGRGRDNRDHRDFEIRPGDLIFVPERLL